jgi:hypothetical protein
MAVVFTKSAALTAMDTPGAALPAARLARTDLQTAIGKVEVSATDSIASILRFVRVPSNARVSQVLLRCTATTGAIGDIGVYRYSKETAAAGTVVDVDLFASAQTFAAALAIWTDVTNESLLYTPTLLEQPLWQAAGLAADPGGLLEIAATLTAAATAAGQVTIEVRYAV